MAKRQRHTPEQVISRLREAEVKTAKGTPIAQVCKDLAVTEQTYYRWRKEFGGMKLDQAKRLRQLEGENARLKRLLADAELDKAILKEAASFRIALSSSASARSRLRRGFSPSSCSSRFAWSIFMPPYSRRHR